MEIVIPTIGSRGDVQPFIALAQGLKRAGHHPVLASHPVMRLLVESRGVRFAPIGPDIDLAAEVDIIRRNAKNTAVGLIRGMRFGFKMLECSHDDILEQCRNADLVVVPTAIAAGKNEAEILGHPYLSVSLMPWAIPWDDPERPLFKRIIYNVIDGLVNLISARPLNRIRRRQGLPPVGKEGFSSTRLNLIPVSPEVYNPNPLWAHHHHMVGYWFADDPDNWEPPEHLEAFLNSGESPILISLGAMSLGEGDALDAVSLFMDAIQRAEIRGIIQGWEAAVEKINLPSSISAVGSVPHSWLLPRCSGIVHHGGYGTTAAGLRAGLPALVIPHVIDQFYWGQKVYELGVGPKPIRRSNLEIKGLADSLVDLARNEKLRITASSLGEQIRSEDGVTNAVKLIEETFA